MLLCCFVGLVSIGDVATRCVASDRDDAEPEAPITFTCAPGATVTGAVRVLIQLLHGEKWAWQ